MCRFCNYDSLKRKSDSARGFKSEMLADILLLAEGIYRRETSGLSARWSGEKFFSMCVVDPSG